MPGELAAARDMSLEHKRMSIIVSDRIAQERQDQAMSKFDADTLRALRDVQEPTIRTDKHPKTAVVIWVVVDGDDVFVRSWLGIKGGWYQDLAAGGPATLEFAGRRLEVQAIPASDGASVDRASREILRKYRHSSHAQQMVRAEILSTTLRLEPR
jgi:hypothetical protein